MAVLGIGLNKDHNEEQYMTGANLLFVQCGDDTIIRTIDDWSQLFLFVQCGDVTVTITIDDWSQLVVVCTMWQRHNNKNHR